MSVALEMGMFCQTTISMVQDEPSSLIDKSCVMPAGWADLFMLLHSGATSVGGAP